MKKKLLALLMTIAMLFSMLPSASFAEEVPTIPQPTETVSAEEPVPVEQPIEEDKPTESATPAPTKEPVATETPSVTEAPTTTEEPAATEEPKATEEPVATEEPAATEEPTATEEPAATEEPTTTVEPRIDIVTYSNDVSTYASYPLSEKNYNSRLGFGFDNFNSKDEGKTIQGIEVYVGSKKLTVNNATTVKTGDAVQNGVTIKFTERGYYLADYKIVCGDKYGCKTDHVGNALKVTGKKLQPGEDKDSILLDADDGITKASFGHSNPSSQCYWLLLNVGYDASIYNVTYNWGELSTSNLPSTPDSEEHMVNDPVTVKAPSSSAIEAAKKLGYRFIGWTSDFNGEEFEGSGTEQFRMPQKNVVLTAQWEEIETTSFTVTKVWDDNNNQDGIRPESVTVYLLMGNEVIKEIELNEANHWTHPWDNLQKFDDNGEKIVYSIFEEEVEGYKSNITSDKETGDFTLTNSHTPELYNDNGEFTVTKTWDDDNNRDGKRPGSITVTLLANDKEYGTVELNADNGWTYTWKPLYKYENGEEIKYTVKEVEVEGYTSSIDGGTITNSHEPELYNGDGKFTVTKVWNDENDRDGIRPPSITVKLLADGKVYGTVELNAANGWTYTWEQLYKYENRKEVEYTVEEVEVNGYTATIDGSTITNSHEPELYNGDGKFTVTKVWNDDNDRDGIRPGSIEVQLYADGTAYGEAITLNADNGWTYTWKQLYKYENGKEIKYTVKEVEVEGYTSSIVGGTITNTHEPEHFGDEDGFVTIRKEWNDKNNQDGKRSESIVVHLQADGVTVKTATLSEANQWTAKFDDLLKYRDGGKEIIYTVVEEVANDSVYTPSYAFDGTNFVFTVTNTYSPETTNKTVTKKWADDDNRDAKRPESITVQLMADGQAYGEALTLTAKDNWTYTWNNLPKYNNGKLITYSIEENAVADYTAEVAVGVDGQFVLTNTHKIATTSKAVAKAWNDDNNRDGIRPTSVTVQLMANGKAYGEAVTLNAGNNWSYSWTKLPVNDNGKKIDYSIVETKVADGYTADVVEKDGTFTLTNSHKIDSTSKTVTKVWNDDNNRDGIRPTSVTVQLFANGKAYGEAVTLNAGNNWSYSWTKLPVNDNGKKIDYSIVETKVADGYTADVVEKDGTFTLTNSHKIDSTSKTVTKIWNDDNNRDGIRPDSVTVQLFANGVAQGEAVQLTKESNWSYTWNNLPTKANGKEIVYTVDETAVDGYTKSIEGMTITNTHIAATTSISTKKIWNDQDNFDGLRPTEVKVQLMANGEVYGAPIVLNEKNEWSYSWFELNVFADGKAIEYSVQEVEVADGYTASYETAEDGTLLIVNTHTANPVSKTVTKVWNDSNDKPGERPDSIKVQLYANGKAYGDVVEVTAKDGWVYTWEALPSFSDGKEIVYTVKEVDVPRGYAASYSDDTFTITNIYRGIPKTGEDNVNPIWFALALMSLLTIEIVLNVDKKRRHI